jgi:hypothetical protein
VEHFCPGHTDGDAWVYFEKADVMALGDTFWNGNYPFIGNEYQPPLLLTYCTRREPRHGGAKSRPSPSSVCCPGLHLSQTPCA